MTQQNGRRLAILEGNLAKPEIMSVVSKHGDRAVDFLWENRNTLAGGAALTAFLVNPEPFLNGTRDIAEVATNGIVKPVVNGVSTIASLVLGVLAVLLVCGTSLISKHGFPRLSQMHSGFALLKKSRVKLESDSKRTVVTDQIPPRQE